MFRPVNLIETDGCFRFSEKVSATAHPCLNQPIFQEFWNNFTFQNSTLSIVEKNELVFSVGQAEKIDLDGNEYSINIEQTGLCLCAKDETSLIRGFMTLLDRFQAVDFQEKTAIEVECCQIKERALIQNRMIHFCIFPETSLWDLQRFVRLCGALKYTHLILEFWGMLKLDCLKELSWEMGYTKEQIRPIVAEAKTLGLEIIPMFNHWGHAPAGRVLHGKHVVLDQNPSLQTYFSEDGWCWDIQKPKVRALLREIRNELMELCGSGTFFHIGCDEAYGFQHTEANMDMICNFINEVSTEVKAQGRRIIVWGDMMLHKHPHYNPNNAYGTGAPTPEAERYFLTKLNKDIVIGDWQYDAKDPPIETASVFKKAGFDCLLCPWDRGLKQSKATLQTVTEENLFGYLHTTWHTLSNGIPYVTLMALGGYENVKDYKINFFRTHTASLLRKVLPAKGNYERSGWCKSQIGFSWE